MEHLIPSMPEAVPPSVEMSVDDDVNPETGELNANFVYEEDTIERPSEEDIDEIELPELPEKKAKLSNDDVFTSAPPLSVAPVKKVRKKRVMTPEALENLAKARQKAHESRRLKKIQRSKEEASDDTDSVPEVFKKPPKERVVEKIIEKNVGYSQDELIKAVSAGVETYDRKRKAEKVLKKERIVKETQEKDIATKINRAINPPRQADPWDFIFR